MSTLTVTSIKKTGETASRDASGVAAAWVNFNGTGTVAIRDSFNVASLTDNSTGDYTVNVTNNFVNANYNGSSMGCGPSDPYRIVSFRGSVSPTTSSFRVATYNLSQNGLEDAAIVGISTHGDLA